MLCIRSDCKIFSSQYDDVTTSSSKSRTFFPIVTVHTGTQGCSNLFFSFQVMCQRLQWNLKIFFTKSKTNSRNDMSFLKTTCRFIYCRKKQHQNERNDMSFLKTTCRFGKRQLSNISFYMPPWFDTHSKKKKDVVKTNYRMYVRQKRKRRQTHGRSCVTLLGTSLTPKWNISSNTLH